MLRFKLTPAAVQFGGDGDILTRRRPSSGPLVPLTMTRLVLSGMGTVTDENLAELKARPSVLVNNYLGHDEFRYR